MIPRDADGPRDGNEMEKTAMLLAMALIGLLMFGGVALADDSGRDRFRSDRYDSRRFAPGEPAHGRRHHDHDRWRRGHVYVPVWQPRPYPISNLRFPLLQPVPAAAVRRWPALVSLACTFGEAARGRGKP